MRLISQYRWLLAGLLILLGNVHAQSPYPENLVHATSPDGFGFYYGPDMPSHPQNGYWYVDRPHAADATIFVFAQGAWQQIDIRIPGFVNYEHGVVVIQSGDQKSVATLDGKLLVKYANHLNFFGNRWIAEPYGHTAILDTNGGTLARYWGWHDGFSHGENGWPQFYCMPADTLADADLHYHDLHRWGMIDALGNWVIAPQYEAPFYFVNGVAEVIYQGRKRKINEKGEFVESLDRRNQ